MKGKMSKAAAERLDAKLDKRLGDKDDSGKGKKGARRSSKKGK